MKLLPTTLVGSYAQPDWLIDRAKLAGRFPPRTRARELWRVAPEFLEEAQDDATLLAIRDQERAGLDIITDGETRRAYARTFDFQTYIWAAIIYLGIVEVLRNAIDWIELRITKHLKR